MNEFYNNLFFYDNPPIELSQIITNLKPHMYTNDTILPDKTPKKEINRIETQNPPEQPLPEKAKLVPIDTISPNKKDSLFWCLYIISYGYSDFMQVTRNHRVRQLEVQKEVIDLIQKNKNRMKNTNMKFTNIATQELTSDLLSITKDINYCIAMSLCVLYKININLIDREKGVYIKFISDTDIELPTYAIYKEDTHRYSVDIEPFTSDKMETMNELICLESYLTPLKTISNYKITELMETAGQLGLVDSDKKYKKKEIYDLIYNKIRW